MWRACAVDVRPVTNFIVIGVLEPYGMVWVGQLRASSEVFGCFNDSIKSGTHASAKLHFWHLIRGWKLSGILLRYIGLMYKTSDENLSFLRNCLSGRSHLHAQLFARSSALEEEISYLFLFTTPRYFTAETTLSFRNNLVCTRAKLDGAGGLLLLLLSFTRAAKMTWLMMDQSNRLRFSITDVGH